MLKARQTELIKETKGACRMASGRRIRIRYNREGNKEGGKGEKNENGKEIERWVGARRAFSTASAANSAIV